MTFAIGDSVYTPSRHMLKEIVLHKLFPTANNVHLSLNGIFTVGSR